MGGAIRRAMLAALGAALAGGTAVIVALLVADDPASDVVQRAVTRAAAQETARAVFTFTTDAPPGFTDRASSFGGEGAFDFARQHSHIRLTFLGALGGDGESGRIEEPLDLELITAGPELLLRMPFLAAATPGGEEWFSVDADTLATLARSEGGLGLGAIDPIQTLGYLRGVIGEVTEIGREPVQGVASTHFRTGVDLDAAVTATPAARRPALAAAVEEFARQFGTRQFPVHVWIDEAELVRRVRFELDLSAGDASGEVPEGAIMSFTMELFDYGDPVEIDPPEAAGVAELADLLDRLDGSS